MSKPEEPDETRYLAGAATSFAYDPTPVTEPSGRGLSYCDECGRYFHGFRCMCPCRAHGYPAANCWYCDAEE
ncbi:hypothetical protein ACU686_26660 [Yinghuangia aomiensis]